MLEAEAYRRAVEGWVEPVGWYKGKAGGTVRRYSDTLLIFTLKGLLPDRYRDRVEGRSVLANIDLAQLPDALLARIAGGEDPRSVLALGSGDGGTDIAALRSGAVEEETRHGRTCPGTRLTSRPRR